MTVILYVFPVSDVPEDVERIPDGRALLRLPDDSLDARDILRYLEVVPGELVSREHVDLVDEAGHVWQVHRAVCDLDCACSAVARWLDPEVVTVVAQVFGRAEQ